LFEDIPFAFDAQPFSFENLWLPAISIFFLGYILCQFILKEKFLAFVIATFKALIFFCYFYFFYDGTYTSGYDDYYYMSKGALLLEEIREKSLASIEIFNVAESFHFTYIIISAIAQYAFGEYYYSLVAINVMASFLCGLISHAIIKSQYQNDKHAKIFCVAMLLYPDVLSWSSVFAGKDIFVLLGHLIFIYAFSNLARNNIPRSVFFIAIALLFTLYLRFYVALIFLLLIALEVRKNFYLHLLYFGLISVALFLDLFATFSSLLSTGTSGLTFDVSKFIQLPYGVLHFWLTPRPFSEDLIHQFLLFSNILNWIFFPFIFYGLLKCIRSKDRFVRFIAVYFLVFSIFYGLIDYLNGPRHRLQLTFALIYFLWVGVSELKLIRKSRRINLEKIFH